VPATPPRPDTLRWSILEFLVRNEEATVDEVTSHVLPAPRRDRPFIDTADWRMWREHLEEHTTFSRKRVSREMGRLQECGLIARAGPARLHDWVAPAIRDKGMSSVLRHLYEIGMVSGSAASVDVDPDDIPSVDDVPGVARSTAVKIILALLKQGALGRTALHRACTGSRRSPSGAWLRTYSMLCDKDIICAPGVRRPTTAGARLINNSRRESAARESA